MFKKLREKWVKECWRQLLELMNLLKKSATDIIATGRNDNSRSLMVHIYNKDVAVIVKGIAKSESVTINLSLSELEGDDIEVSNTFLE
ncbi:hypothetical protein [Infirmifilum sp.]|uniref:hypothetical protein n=1 Tax=Infirmifilum sp. TaxID=2856575 RepID=UPI003D124DC7